MTLFARCRIAVAIVAALATAPLMFAAAAQASDLVVTFHGQPDITSTTVSCPSQPDTTSLSVVSGTTVNFVNDLGVAATLWSTDSHEDVDDGDMVPVTFSGGTASVVMEMLPKCTLDVGTHTPMTMHVAAAPVGVSVSPSPGGTSPGPTAKPHPSGPASSAHGSSDRPSGAKHRASPSASRSTVISGAGNGGDADPVAIGVASNEAAFVSFGAPVSADPRHGASGLLTLIATVFVGGVSAAAIRAIMAQRATFTSP